MTEPLRIMIVDDEAVILMQLEMLLEEAGHLVVGTAMSAGEALRTLPFARPELLLLDLHLSDGSSGLDVARAVRDMANLTTVIVTANLLKLDEEMEGAAAAIGKPFNDRTIEDTVAFMEQCVRRPPPLLNQPAGLHLAPAFLARMESLRGAAH